MIYADNAATTKISDRAFKEMLPFLQEQYGNASSQYSIATKARQAISKSRSQVANAINADPSEIIFTSGGTEGNNWVLRSVAESFNEESVHIITSSVEHHSVLSTCGALEKKGVEITYLPVDNVGRVSLEDIKAAIKPQTKLVSIMFANNEIGTIQPISEIGVFLKKEKILFHTDAVQAVGHMPIDVYELNVDFLTASAHKFNGPKGVGFIFKKSSQYLYPFIFGGNQELKQRAGTENVAGIVALGHALEENLSNMIALEEKLKHLVSLTECEIRKNIHDIKVNACKASRLPGLISISIPGVTGESIMRQLDLHNIFISTSSACHSGENAASHVLLAIGLNENEAKSTIRISYGRFNNVEDVKVIVANIVKAHQKITAALALDS